MIQENDKITKQQNNLSEDKISLSKIKQALDELKKEKIIKEENGFYWINQLKNTKNNSFCRPQENLLKIRLERNEIAKNKYKKALRVIKILKCAPCVKMIAVCNSLSYNNAKIESDIDIFIISSKNKIWTTRLLATGILKLLCLRPTPKNSKNKICASFFTSEDNLDLEKIQINKGGNFRQNGKQAEYRPQKDLFDIYLLYWIATLVPIYDKNETYAKLIKANNWIKKMLPNWERYLNYKQNNKKNKILSASFYLIMLFISEKFSKKIQMRIMPEHFKNMANKDTRIIITDSMLKFHDKDRREEYYYEWLTIKNLLI
ncbi:MAG: hypothetical protein V1891_02025 [bacterium]